MKKVNRQEWAECPRCGAKAYQPCRNYRGVKKPPCRLVPPEGNDQLGAARGTHAGPKQGTLFGGEG